MSRKVAFVTGASRGIGKACAIELAKVGYDIAVTARTVQEGEDRGAFLHAAGVRHVAAAGKPEHRRRRSARDRT